MVPRQAVIRASSEVDMSTSRINEGGHAHHTISAAVWLLVGIVALVAFGDVVAVLALALAIVTLVLWGYREVEHRLRTNDAEMAPVTTLRPAFTGQSDPQHAPTPASWRASRAA
jgi:hypothetical protein